MVRVGGGRGGYVLTRPAERLPIGAGMSPHITDLARLRQPEKKDNLAQSPRQTRAQSPLQGW